MHILPTTNPSIPTAKLESFLPRYLLVVGARRDHRRDRVPWLLRGLEGVGLDAGNGTEELADKISLDGSG